MDRQQACDRLDRGQALPLALVVVVACALAAVAVGRTGEALVAHQRAQQAADAAALAGVDGGEAVAAEIAGANGAVIVSFRRVLAVAEGDGAPVATVTVTVRVGSSSATARATNGP